MLLSVISPAKRLAEPAQIPELSSAASASLSLEPRFASEVGTLVRAARKLRAKGLQERMHISDDLATLNAQRFKDFVLAKRGELVNDIPGAMPAMHMFQGDVYQGLNAATLSPDAAQRAQQGLRILSGLYGLLRPYDLVQPYRLEMGTSIDTRRGSTLYAFWDDKITKALNQDVTDHGVEGIVNLASQEYWGAVKPKKLKAPLVTALFKEWRGDQLKVISFSAKTARGMMARYLLEQGADRFEALKDFCEDGYSFSAEHSDQSTYVFTRPQP